jgi:hypothetical protein
MNSTNEQVNLADRMAAARRKYAGHRAASWAKLARAKASGDTSRIIEAAEHCVYYCSSEQRLVKVLRAVDDQPPEVFWPVWLNNWSCVDRVADLHFCLPALFKLKGPAHPFFDSDKRAMFDALPDTVIVYRGCDRRFTNDGVAWTTEHTVAEYFARGGRYGRPCDPVIATAQITKASADLFYVAPERDEAEIVCKPTIVKVESFTKLDWVAHPGTLKDEALRSFGKTT